MSAFQNIKLVVEAGVARLTLARPDALNALSRPLLREMITALDALRQNREARVLLITGEGRGFSSGADLSAGNSPVGSPDFDGGEVLEQYYNPLIERMFALPLPIVSAIHGPVVGAGCSIALSADIVIAAESAYFLQAFINVGLVPDAGSMWLLPRLIGRSRALSMMMLGERIPAKTALDWGLVHDVVADADLATRVAAITEKLARGPTLAYALIRQGVRKASEQTLSETLVYEREAQRLAGASADFAEGVAAFREKRPAKFTGR
ncbi:2-(1,2-epoxy-1,2-dihydrophenyl)acetyl-CoA isomerase [Niveispirillum sp. SYP-B3756]|uniref:enoyl-CoA hydratase-related protein n=1 Tax=Niveispirillum sp. SYP-B3756 TaxID=2662178 RepID=UPI0012911DE4|nr:enoyl-CoA hydratase-related protein [Niveispirillum sp. SYP-B3756]MQP68322.1 2-(1,2-epoxy-1,2-dihydrophenyl)acetyl-CoA isomerase [Niveispirillum sp. SYP-B3756]